MAWNGHIFEVVNIYGKHYEGQNQIGISVDGTEHEISMILYHPVDPRLIESDCEGALLAESNGDDDGWLFHHCDQDYMRDREIELRSGVIAVLQPTIDTLIESVITATDTKPRDWPIGEPWENRLVRRLRLNEMLGFRDKVIDCILEDARDNHIGWYHQNQHSSHLYNLVHDCIATTYRDNADTYSNVSTQIIQAAGTLSPHNYETRWDKVARLERERKAKAESNE